MGLDSELQKLEGPAGRLKETDFELAYLAVLTRCGIKPLSRWEKPLDGRELLLLSGLGLLTRQLRRTVKTGREVVETIFSVSSGYLDAYERRFAGTPVSKSAAAVRFEGFLFGFPPCCVDSYIRHPYTRNDLDREQQKILFHWACKGCKITPYLWPAYKAVHDWLSDSR